MVETPYSEVTHDHEKLKADYENKKESLEKAESAVLSILQRILPHKLVVAITFRVKDFNSFFGKANKLIDGKLKYASPIDDIHDLVGFRIVVLAQKNIIEVRDKIKEALDVIEEEDKAVKLLQRGQLGYESYHLICKLGEKRTTLTEYKGLCEQRFEIQIRTALQHAWAENEHRIQYKKSKHPELQKRFLRLAAAISSADEEFDRIYEINSRLEVSAAAADSEIIETGIPTESTVDTDTSLSAISRLFGKKPSELMAEARYAEAIQVYDRLINAQPTQVSHIAGRAKAHALGGDIQSGLADLELAQSLAPHHPATRAVRRFFERLRESEGW